MIDRKQRIIASLEVIQAMAEVIRNAKQIPSGELYALVMDKMSLDIYESYIKALVGANLVKQERNHLLVWIGPVLQENN